MYRRGASVGFTGSKSVYDDVHGGPPRLCVSSLAPCVEDYSEIFGSFHALRASSIPVLDLPDVDETEVFLDACSSSFDYNEVFRSFNSLDFSVSFEDLVNRSDSGDADSNEEVWSPAAFNSMSEEFDISGTDHLFSNGDPYHSFVGSPEVNISYHKANSRSNGDIFNEIAHVTELHAVPGFVCTVKEMSKVLLKNAEKPSLSVTDDNNLSTDYNLEKRKAKHLKETVLCPFNDSCAGQSFENYIRPHRYDRNDSSYRETFVSISEIDLRTRPSQMPPPSRPPPSVEDTKGDSSKNISDYSSVVSEGTSDDSSPSFFDVEIDACSSSAVSAAAIKEAMENAKAKLKSAREQMEKKKEGFQNSTGLDSKKDIKEEGRVRKIVDESNRMKDERIKGTCEREDNEANLSVREEKKNVWKTALEVQELIEGESLLNAPEKIDEANEWKDESQFFELVTMDESMKDFELTCTKKSLGLGAKVHGQKQKAAMETLEEQSEYVRRAKPVIEDHDLLELEKKHKVRIEPCGLEETKIRSVPVREASEQKKNENKIPVATENCEPRMNENFTIDEKNCETEKKINGSDKFKNHNNVMEAESKERKSMFKQNLVGADKVVEIGKILEQSHKNVLHKDRHEALEKEGKEKMLLEAFEVAGNVKVLKILEQEANEKRSKELLEKVESEKRLEMAMKQQDNERILKVDFEQLENEKRLREASKRKKGKKTLKEASKKREYKKQLKGAPEQDQLERTHKVVEFDNAMEFAYERTEVRKSVSSCTSEDNRMRSIGAQNNFERQAKTYEAFEQVEGHKVPKEASEWETAKIFKSDIDLEDRKELKKVYRSMEKNKINRETQSAEGNAVHGEKEVKSAKRNHVHIEQEIKSAKQSHLSMEEDDLCVCDEPCELVDFMKTFLPNRFYNIDESIEVIKAFGEANAHKDKGEMRSECRINEKQARAVEMENVSLFESFKASDRAEEELEQDKCQSSMKNAKKSFPLDGNVNKVSGEREREESENGKNKCPIQGSDISLPSNNFMKEVVEGGAVVEQLHEERTKSFPQVECVPENQERDFDHQHKERLIEVKYAQVAPIQELNRDKVMPTGPMKECVEIMRETGASQLAAPEGKQKSQKLDQQATQTTERRGKNITEPFTPEDNVTEKMKRERELENERLQKIEEEREREKEREKDRMAVDLATLEARKNAYAEAREKTERASVERMTTEARQRAMAEARERLERACAEAREKSSVGKAAMEAKIRAEHVAVERAMAEVREHAAEKAKAERVAFEAIERVQRSVSDKFSTSRNNVMRQSYSSSDLLDMQFQSTRDLYSSTFGERYEGVESESAQRCKARLERHRRTAERAAKALAEKNMRDLIAQREQAVRNRIAETLDADVRRWSSGKEGNLRALLSTLQYILGPDSGWQPIPLTEVITSAAVKKAYRKATLCVHPDKLQQRGASIQQKYTCEKVYDLLKEAWNKFNSEER